MSRRADYQSRSGECQGCGGGSEPATAETVEGENGCAPDEEEG